MGKSTKDTHAEEITICVTGESTPLKFGQSTPAKLDTGEECLFVSYHTHGVGDDRQRGHIYKITEYKKLNLQSSLRFSTTPDSTVEDVTPQEVVADFLITSDTHIGYRHRKKGGITAGRNKQVPWYDRGDCCRGFQNVIDKALELNVDALIHAGDLFDHGVTTEEKNWLRSQLRRLNEQRIAFAYILGNHDPNDAQDILADIKSADHIGDGQPRSAQNVTVIGYDTTQRRRINREYIDRVTQDHSGTVLIVGHPTDSGGIFNEEGTLDVPDQCYLVLGHQHKCVNNITETGGCLYPGTPADMHPDKDPFVWRMHLANGYCTVSNIRL